MSGSSFLDQSFSPSKRPRIEEPNKKSTSIQSRWAGRIKNIQLRNFMCHSNFEIELNPRVNFISGLNGSGKSAIQTSIVIGLGGTAFSTNRSTALKGLIKHGCKSATVKITLWNTGSGAYRKDKLNDVIVVIRDITQTTTTTRICDEKGNVIWNKKKDLMIMLHHFSIYVSNPITVLNQDVSRTLLKNSNPKTNYELFKKAILLDIARQYLELIQGEINTQDDILGIKKVIIDEASKKVREMDRKIRLQAELSKLERNKKEIEVEYAWSIITSKAEDISRYKFEVNKLQNRIAVDAKDALNAKEVIKALENQREEIEKRIHSFHAKKMRQKEEMAKKLAVLERKSVQYNYGTKEKESLERQLARKREDKVRLQRSIEIQQRQQLENEEKIAIAIRKINEVKNDLNLLDCGLKTLLRDKSNMDQTLLKKQSDIHVIENSLRHDREELRKNNGKISSAENAISTKLNVYGRWMPRVIDEIRNAVSKQAFRQAPCGPIGSCITVKDEEWIPALENILPRQLLSSFYVCCGEDRKTLLGIFDRVIGRNEQRPDIYIGKFANELYDISNTESVSWKYSNIFRSLNIHDTKVANFLIDTMKIETIMLIKNDEECYQLSSQENVPKNLFKAYNLEADEYRPYPCFRRYGNTRLSRSYILNVSSDEMISVLRRENNKIAQTMKDKEDNIPRLNNEMKTIRNEVDKINKDIDKLTADIRKKRSEIIECQAVAQVELPDGNMMNNELDNISADILNLEERIQRKDVELMEQFNELTNLKKLADEEVIIVEDDDTHLRNELRHNQSEVNKHEALMDEEISRKQHNLQLIEKLNKAMKDAEGYIESLKNKYKDAEEIENPRLLEVLKTMSKKLQDTILQRKTELESIKVEIDDDFLKKREMHEDVIDQYNTLKIMNQKEKEMIELRRKIVSKYRESLTQTVKDQFEAILKRREYKGALEVNHDDEKLTIKMAPSNDKNKLVNTSSLSGGERSFSTVSFLIALWSTMKLPFYSMDEYDVFMDGLNRQIITDTIIAFTKMSTSQFIFLTPLDISNVQTSPELSVHRLTDPRD